jgi:hypothetical protein
MQWRHVAALGVLVVITFGHCVRPDGSEQRQRDEACEVHASSEYEEKDNVEGYVSLLQDNLNLLPGHGHLKDDQHGVHEVLRAASLTPMENERGRTGKGGGRFPGSRANDNDKDANDHTNEPFYDRPAFTIWVIAVGAVAFCMAAMCCRHAWYRYHEFRTSPRTPSPKGERRTNSLSEHIIVNHDSNEETDYRNVDVMDQDAYTLAIALIVRDLWSIAQGNPSRAGLKYGRLLYAYGLIVCTGTIQIGLIVMTKLFVTPMQVADIRNAYHTFETTMYGDHVTTNEHGNARGVDGFFNMSAFDTLSDDDKSSICNIPFGQLWFIALIVLIWSVTCTAALRQCIERFVSVIIMTDTEASMASAMKPVKMAMADNASVDVTKPLGQGVLVITGLTVSTKVLLVLVAFLPELGATSYILWLGSRWLLATNDWGNLVSNAVALEFILQLKSLMYYAMASERNKRDLDHTALAPPWTREPAGFGVYFITAAYAVLAGLWVWMYIFHLQQVLPDYNWDVHEVCAPWLSGLLAHP